MKNGTQVRLVEKVTFDHLTDGVAALATAGAVIATNVDISGYLYGSLVLRLHSWTRATSAPVIWLVGYGSAPTAEDPAVTFRSSTALIDGNLLGAGITFSSGMVPTFTAAGTVFGGSAAGVPGFLDVEIFCKQGGTASAGTTFTVSVDLILRS